MKERLLLISSLLINCIIFAQTPFNDPHWKLDWEDQFNTFNTNIWLKADSCGHGKNQLYLKEQVWVENGNLVIELTNTQSTCSNPAPNPPTSWACGSCEAGKKYNYRSGMVETRYPLYQPQYGYIEARIKLPWKRENNKTWGFFPAFWTFLGDGIQNPSNAAEIDIFEMFAGDYKLPNTINTCIHTCYNVCDNPPICYLDCRERYGKQHVLLNFDYSEWHTYGLEWSPERITWLVDDKTVRAIENKNLDRNGKGIIDPARILLNLAVQDDKFPPTSPSFSAKMYVDYVKVYTLKCDKTKVINEIANFNTYNYAVKKSITLSNAATIPANSNITLRATDYIELKPDFEVQTGRELYLDVSPCEMKDMAQECSESDDAEIDP